MIRLYRKLYYILLWSGCIVFLFLGCGIAGDASENIYDSRGLQGIKKTNPETENIILAQLDQDERDWLEQHHIIRVLSQKNLPPFNYRSGNRPLGYSIDYMNMIAQKLGVTVKYISDISWEEALRRLKDRELDVVLNVIKTPEREEYMAFSEPYAKNPSVIVCKKEKPISSLAEFSGKTIAVQKGMYYANYFREHYPDVKIYDTNSVLESLQAVALEKADVTIGEQAVVNYIIRENLLTGLVICGQAEFRNKNFSSMRIGARSDWKKFVAIINKVINLLPESEKNLIYNKWAKGLEHRAITTTSITGRDMLRSFYLTLGSIFAILVLFFSVFWYISRKYADIFAHRHKVRYLHFASIIIMVCVISAIIYAAAIGLNNIKTRVRQNMADFIETVANATNSSLKEWIYVESEYVASIAREPQLRKNIREIVVANDNSGDAVERESFYWILNRFTNESPHDDKYGIFVIGIDNTTLVSTVRNNVGSENVLARQYPLLINKAFTGDTVFIPPFCVAESASGEEKICRAFIISPIYDTGGTVIALLALGYDPQKDFAKIFQMGTILTSGETYAFNNKGQMLSPSLYHNQLVKYGLIEPEQSTVINFTLRDPGGDILNGYVPQKPRADLPLTYGVESAITQGNTYMVAEYRDYRGVPVLGYWLWNYELNIGIITEIDVEEADYGYNTDKNIIISILSVTLLLSVLFVGFVLWSGERSKFELRKAKDEWERLAGQHYQELRSREERFSAIFNQSIQQLIVLDCTGRIREVNNTTLSFTGSTSEDLVGKYFVESVLWKNSNKPLDFSTDILRRVNMGEIVKI